MGDGGGVFRSWMMLSDAVIQELFFSKISCKMFYSWEKALEGQCINLFLAVLTVHNFFFL